ncbi:GLUG motif-containing protein [Rhizobium sp. RU36D]|uniref:two-partner secretion domain-containing protein n=1 Tax=Rhizobium sp. RU36D TaxID=1907415 RepID=UPI0009D7B2FD|nr:GLUG motif-containing protein [Rhizobium sp. RU36D]SMC54039.1 filamentous hemagglutinin family N-terminal domain-containing protein [Rhizobium sp. RU36D]
MTVRVRSFRRKTALLLATVSLPLPAISQEILPTGGSFVAGSGDFQTSANGLVIDQTSGTAIVEWQGFSVGSGAQVHFDNGAGATLNRVTGNIGSEINGSLTATGSVYLVNPAGIVVGPGGTISTGGNFFASTHDVSNQQFLAGGDMTFAGESKASVVNLGRINSATGDVALIARAVDNSGTITAENGTVGLLAGYEILAKDAADDDGLFAVVVGGSDTEASNSGMISAANAELRANGGNVYALAGNTGGVVKATGVSSQGGRIFLTAGAGGKVKVTGKVSATRRQTASLPTHVPVPQPRPESGGDIRISGREVRLESAVEAKGTTGAGGTIVATGDRVLLGSAALVDASGATGGTVLIGGDFQGGYNPATKLLAENVATADKVAVLNGAKIRVDGTSGAGGRAVVWSDDTTIFDGMISATAASGGAGGLVETSGHNLLLGGNVAISTLSESGAAGTWLIDPYNITISSSATSTLSVDTASNPWSVNPNGSGANINSTTLSSYLASSNVTITTNGAGVEAGNITVNATVSWSTANTLSLIADASTGGVFINSNITGTNSGSSLILSAGSGGISQAGGTVIRAGTMTVTTANGGSVSLTNGNLVSSLGTSSVDGSFSLTTNEALTVTGNITTNGTLSLVTNTGNLTVNGLLTDSHANSSLTLNAAAGLSIGKSISRTGSGAAVSLNYGASYSLINGARISLPGSSATLTINSQAYTLIRDVTGLQAIGTSGYYALAGDIDASATSGWNSNAGFAPISGFTGTFSGLGHIINGLTINRSGTTRQGLFGDTNNATLRDVTLSNISVTGSARVGGLVGEAANSTFTNIHVTGSVTASQEAGGIAGWIAESTLSKSSSSASVTVTANGAGGLAGYALYTVGISDSYATGSVTAATNAGGLVGQALGGPLTLSNVYASGKVTGTSSAGGLLGVMDQGDVALTNAYWDANSTGQAAAVATLTAATATGSATDVSSAPRTQATYSGFDFTNTWVMINDTRPMLRNEYSTVIVTAAALQLMSLDLAASYKLGSNLDLTSAFTAAGGYYSGLWGSSGFSSIGTNSTAFTGSFDGQNHTITGLSINRSGANYVGLFGYTNGATVSNVVLSGGSFTGNSNVGSLIGYMQGGSVSAASSNATVSSVSTTESNAGGLIGTVNGSAVSDTWANGNVTGAGYNVGGLVGYLVNGSTITRSYATGNVTGTSTSYGYIGGFVGNAENMGITISESYATGTVTGSAGPIGGFIGHNQATITDSYSTGNVVGLGSATEVGGFAGANYMDGTISNAYSTGRVSGASSIGGFAGYNYNTSSAITNAYWNTQTSGQSSGIGGGSGSATARTTAQLQGSLPAGFSSSIWGTGTNLYPYLQWRYSTTPTAVSGYAYSDAGTTALTGATVTAVSGGSRIGSGGTGDNGYYYILLAPGTSVGSSGVMTYLDEGATKGAAFTDIVGTNGVQNISIYGTAARITTGATTLTATRTNYLSATNGYADNDLSFLSGSSTTPLTTTAGYGLYLNTTGNYTLDASLGSSGLLSLDSGGTFGVSGAITLSAAGALSIADAVSWSDSSSLTLTTTSSGNVSLGGAVTATSGTLTLNAAGSISTTVAINVGTFNFTAGTWSQVAATLPSFSANNFALSTGATFLRATGGDGTAGTPYQIADIYGLQGMASSSLLAQNFVLTGNISATATSGWNSGAGFLSIGNSTTAFTGSLSGAGYTISGLTVSRPTISAGLFGVIGSGGSVSNLTVSGTVNALNAGILVGANGGTISNVTTSGSAGNTGASFPGRIGGIAGSNSGTITGSSSSATVSAADSSDTGGLVGTNTGTVSGSYATGSVTTGNDGRAGGLVGYHVSGTVSGSFATGAVTAGTGTTGVAGGLVGVNDAAITNTYATGNITGGVVGGGLVGNNSGTITNSYATGTLPSAAAPYGGLIGHNTGTATASFWNTTTSGTSLGVGSGSSTGVTGISTTQMRTLSTFTGASWSIDDAGGTSSIWRIYGGNTGPLLRGFMTAMTVTGGSGTKVYDASASSTDVGTLTYSISGYNTSLVSGTAGYTSSSANVGGYSGAGLTLGGLYSSQLGYDLTLAAGSLSITTRAITVTADDKSMTAGSTVPSLTYVLGGLGLAGSDSLTGSLATSASSTSSAGVYSITQGTLAASANYAMTFVDGALTVTGTLTPTPNPTPTPTPTPIVIPTLPPVITPVVPTVPVQVQTVPVVQVSSVFPSSSVIELSSSISFEQAAADTQDDATSCPSGAVMGAACASVPHPVNRSVSPFITFGSIE